MSKTLIWVLVGVLVAAVSAAALVEFRPRASSVASAAAVGEADTKGGSPTVPAAAPLVAAEASNPIAGPGTTQPTATSSPVSAMTATALSPTPTVDDLIQNAAAYEGKPISLKGTILTQCTAGCEFALDDGTGVLSVQLEGRGKDRLIPLGKVGKTIQVLGIFRSTPRPQVIIEDPNGWQFVKS
jgi:uncharacterized protein YdeI (BOF family)